MNLLKRQLLGLGGTGLVVSLLSGAAFAAGGGVMDMSIEELLKVEVTTVSRKSQTLADTAAAVFVISAEDIRRSGVTSIPEALRMVPGVEVGRIANNRWAVSARGFNGRFANKLLVLMDGRTIYSPLFSGVFWESQDTLLEDIERIEVVRGPGGALWGANAVNGIINIITKKVKDTQGGLLTVSAGTEERAAAAVRFGADLGEDTRLRVFVKGSKRDESVSASGAEGNDYTRDRRVGFRLDKQIDAGQGFTLIGDAYHADTGDFWNQPTLTPPFSVATAFRQENRGINLLGRYAWRFADGSEATLQAFIDATRLAGERFLTETRDTYDVDFQHRLNLGGAHDLIWGLAYRMSRDRIRTEAQIIQFAPERRNIGLWSAFLHDEFTLLPERLRLIAGAKVEHTSLVSSTDFQPNLRFLWTPTASDTIWGAWSRAVRTPSRGELDDRISAVRPGPFGTVVVSQVLTPPDRSLDSEVVRSLELGYRGQFAGALAVDLAAYWNRFSSLRSIALGTPVVNFPQVNVPVERANANEGRARGLEMALDWHPAKDWRLNLAYSTQKLVIPRTSDAVANDFIEGMVGNSPRYQVSLRSSWNLSHDHAVDLWLRRVGGLSRGNIPAYNALDLRYSWRISDALDVAIVGQNLLDPQHEEFLTDLLPAPPLEIERGAYVKATWRF
jgi:iron complex outermembrane receptor protein